MVRLPSLPRLMLTRADFPEQDWSTWRRREIDESPDDDGATIDTSYLNVMPCCIHCATWICTGCHESRRSRASRAVSQYCSRCGSRKGFFIAIRHLKPHEALPKVPFTVPRMTAIPEGDPRYNLAQDLIEGDSHRQNWAMNLLEVTKHMNLVQAMVYITQHPYRPDPERINISDWGQPKPRTPHLFKYYKNLAWEQPGRDRLWENQVKSRFQGCPAGDPCPGTGCPACCPSYDPCGGKKCTFRCNNPRLNSKPPVTGVFVTPSGIPVEMEIKMKNQDRDQELENRDPGYSCDGLASNTAKLPQEEINQTQPTYPYDDGQVVVLGPEIFVDPEAEVICWRGENWVKQPEPQDATKAGALADPAWQKREALEFAIRAAAPASSTQRPIDRTAQIVDTADAILTWLQK